MKMGVVRAAQHHEILRAFAPATGVDPVVDVQLLIVLVAHLAPVFGPRQRGGFSSLPLLRRQVLRVGHLVELPDPRLPDATILPNLLVEALKDDLCARSAEQAW